MLRFVIRKVVWPSRPKALLPFSPNAGSKVSSVDETTTLFWGMVFSVNLVPNTDHNVTAVVLAFHVSTEGIQTGDSGSHPSLPCAVP